MQRSCRFCGAKDGVARVKKRFWACPKCKQAVYAVINSPDTIEQVWPLLQDRAILPQTRRIKIPWKTEIPEELDAKRYRTTDRDKNDWYLVVSEHAGSPVEVFVSTAQESDHSLQMNFANLTALTRLISLMLRHLFLGERITLAKVKRQLSRSSRLKKDLPDMVLTVLDKYDSTYEGNGVGREEKGKINKD